MSPALAPCEEKTRLLRDHLMVTAEYKRAVTLLREQFAVLRKREYDAIRKSVENTKESIDETRVALERHTAEHGC